ncbi:MAG: ChaN family lipoprotein [Leadbetterella sp.]|nr:ChaN family lipoprotein [Leadbetterella sp.]
MRKLSLLALLCGAFSLQAQDMPAYRVYNAKGKAVDFGKMIRQLEKYDVVLFGEYHNNSIVHWLELKTTEALYEKAGNRLMLGAEMFERDNQEAVNRYLAGESDDKKLAEEARLWKNHPTDYKPLLDFAKAKKLPMVATNVPRRYASTVARKGVDSLILEPQEKAWVVKLPYTVTLETPGYEEMRKMMGDHAGGKAMNFVAAQAIKDATMAESILQHLEAGKLLLHYHGDFHSKQYGGIYWYLKQARPDLKVAVISLAESEDNRLPLPGDFVKTDFNLVIPKDMTKTY